MQFNQIKKIQIYQEVSQNTFSRILFVDGQNGNDGTAKKGSDSSCYKSIIAAKTAAVAGDLIWVLPGNYADYNLFKNNVNYYFCEGAVVQPVNPLQPIWNDMGQGVIKCSVLGRGTFINKGYSDNDSSTIVVYNNGTDIYFEAKKVNSVECWGQGSKIRFKGVEFAWETNVYNGGFIEYTDCYFNNSVNIAVGHWRATKARYLNCIFNTTVLDAEYRLVLNDYNINFFNANGGLKNLNIAGGSSLNLYIRNCLFHSSNSNILIRDFLGAPSVITLENSTLYSTDAAKFAIQAPATKGFNSYKFTRSSANRNLGGGATFVNALGGEGILFDSQFEPWII